MTIDGYRTFIRNEHVAISWIIKECLCKQEWRK